jgi:hypothetical protein
MMGYRTPNIDSIAKDGAIFTDEPSAAVRAHWGQLVGANPPTALWLLWNR